MPRPSSARLAEPLEPGRNEASASAPLPSGGLEWSEARTRLLESNPGIGAARARIERAAAGIEAARATRRPQLDLSAELLAADAPSSYLFKTIDARGLEPMTDFNDPGSFGSAELGLDFRWNLWDGGGSGARVRAAEAVSGAAETERRVVEDALVEALSEGWIAVRASEEHIRSAEISVRTVAAQLSEVRARFDAGRALRSDLLSLEVRLAEAREHEIRARSARRLALAGLAQLVGAEPAELVGDGPAAITLPEDVGLALEIALEERPELELARRHLAAATAQLDSARATRSVRADLFARVWRGETDGGYDDPEQNWLVGLKLGLPLVDGGGRDSGVEAARAASTEARFASDRLWRQVEHEVRSAWLRLAEARTRAEVAAAAVEQSEETLELVRRQYEAGSAAITRYMEAELMWADARRRKADAGFDIRRAEFAAARSLGWAPRLLGTEQ